MKEFFGLDQLWGVLLISFLTALYTILGGLKAVAVTESIQSVMLLGGSILITIFAWQESGGMSEVMKITEPSHFNIVKAA